jgi:hypothetical protein
LESPQGVLGYFVMSMPNHFSEIDFMVPSACMSAIVRHQRP